MRSRIYLIMNRPWYQEHLNQNSSAGQETLAQITLREVDFIEREIAFDRSKNILDVGCGNGRHALELARRGYQVIGVDLDDSVMAPARKLAAAENLPVTFINRDARALNFYDRFHVALLMREGAFSLMETDEMDWLILRNVARALLPAGRFIMTVPNAAYAITHLANSTGFDVVTLRESFTRVTSAPDGSTRKQEYSQRYYTCPEIRGLLRQSGFQKTAFFAVTDSGFERNARPSNEHFELGVLADK